MIDPEPAGVILIIVLFGLYPDPLLIILTSTILPLDTTAFNLAKIPTCPFTLTTSSSGGVVYSDPPLLILTPSILPPTIIGVINPFFPVRNVIVGVFM